MIDNAHMPGGLDRSMNATAIVFISVAITAAGLAYRIMYTRKPVERPPVMPPPLPAVSAPAAMYCPVCGLENPAGTPMCACGYNLASIQMPASPYSPASPAAAGSTRARRPRNGWVIFDEPSARNAARQGMWGAFLVAIVTAAVAVLAGSGVTLVNGIGPLAWIDAAVFAFLGMGIKSMNRAAAVAALVLYVVEQVALFHSTGFNPVMIGMVLSFAQGVRGTFAFHKYREQSSYRTYASGMAPPYQSD
jgi:hypothetical protein